MIIPRIAENTLDELARGYPVIGITGPRQSGKSTLARKVFGHKPYVSLENPDMRMLADEDPRGFLATYRNGAIFDEAQRCPQLFSYLQGMVDDNPLPGRFIVTGSQQFGLWSGITQSLAGRIAMLHLLPFSYQEWYDRLPDSERIEIDDVLQTGLYPPIHDRRLRPDRWYANYVQTYIERDVRQLINVHDLGVFQRFVRLCAGHIGQLLNLSNLAVECGITHNTAKAWISVLEASYLIFLLQPHHRNFNKRLIKTSKLYFYDTGLASWLLGIYAPEHLHLHPMRGALFESFVIGEFMKRRYNRALPAPLYFWRDRSGNEVDVVIAHADGLQPVEIKSGQTLTSDSFAGLHRWLKIAGAAAHNPLLVYGGDDARTHNGIRVMPWFDAESV